MSIWKRLQTAWSRRRSRARQQRSSKGSTSANVGNAYGKSGIVSATQGVTSQQAHVVSDTTVNFALKHGQAYCFKMTVVDGANQMPSFTVGNGDVLKTQFVAKIGNDYYYRVYAIGTARARVRACTPPCRAMLQSNIV